MPEEFDRISHAQDLSEEQSDEKADGRTNDEDETTGASPGTAQACDDLGLNSLQANHGRSILSGEIFAVKRKRCVLAVQQMRQYG